MRYLKDFLSARELLANLTLREVKGKYKRTVFGQLWSLVNPLAVMLVYTLVFGILFQLPPQVGDPSGIEYYALWLLCGLLPWLFFAGVLNAGTSVLVGNAGLIQKVYFPRAVLPLSVVGAVGFNWLFEMAVLAIVLSIAGAFVLPWLPLVIVTMLLLALFASGIALMLSIANVYFRDTEHLLSIALQMWMYLTPIIYPVSLVAVQSDKVGGLLGTPVTLLDIYQLNPMASFVEVFRNLLYDNRFPDTSSMVTCLIWAVGMFAIGLTIFARKEKGLAEAL
ncbi:ABC transporter permease [Salinibacterium hongtaonis]|uniref:ABC transporter permease n=1 Tax=Homoserinimonas hongtaonis TaxID=2079791 RepID=UPI000D34EBEB|nr:ABC transporter permease [Salinibacterium hongtaonis]AWB88634.1 ABC transporter permease [Salinibacterium hongtaonis]